MSEESNGGKGSGCLKIAAGVGLLGVLLCGGGLLGAGALFFYRAKSPAPGVSVSPTVPWALVVDNATDKAFEVVCVFEDQPRTQVSAHSTVTISLTQLPAKCDATDDAGKSLLSVTEADPPKGGGWRVQVTDSGAGAVTDLADAPPVEEPKPADATATDASSGSTTGSADASGSTPTTDAGATGTPAKDGTASGTASGSGTASTAPASGTPGSGTPAPSAGATGTSGASTSTASSTPTSATPTSATPPSSSAAKSGTASSSPATTSTTAKAGTPSTTSSTASSTAGASKAGTPASSTSSSTAKSGTTSTAKSGTSAPASTTPTTTAKTGTTATATIPAKPTTPAPASTDASSGSEDGLVAFTVRADDGKARGVTVNIDGKSVGTVPLSTRVAPGSRKVKFSGNDVDLTCTVSVGDSGRSVSLSGHKPVCPK